MSGESSTSTPEPLAELIERARAVDGEPPFSDQSLVELHRAERTLISAEHGAAVFSTEELELVIDPEHRGQGHGAKLVETALHQQPGIDSAWAHGDHPASRALAARFGFEPVRTLLQLRTRPGEADSSSSASAPSSTTSAHRKTGSHDALDVSAFRPGIDDAEWLALNAIAFANHPEQGSLTQRDLDDRKAEPWFDAVDFLMLREGPRLIGFCWLKIEGTGEDASAAEQLGSAERLGEFYAVGIDPSRQGEGLGRVLMDAGFARLAERDIRTAVLYVEADNEPALALYHRYGFHQHTIDVRYRRTRD